MDLSTVDWDAAIHEIAGEYGGVHAAGRRRTLAALSSLRARFTDDLGVASAAIASAQRLEPVDPLHRVRGILVKARFGNLSGAIADIEALPSGLADLPRVLVIKAFAYLHQGEASTARNTADRACQINPQYTAARFLRVEAIIQALRKGGFDKLAELPRSPNLEPAWADLLAKLAIRRPGDHRAVIAQLERGVLDKAGRAGALVRSVLSWTSPETTVDELVRSAEGQVAGSRGEELVLALLASKLAAGDPVTACTALRDMAQRNADRPAMRRAMAAALTRLAVAEASAERLSSALRIIHACVEIEPHEPAHLQNRAVVFTLLGEHEAALDAWAELDQLHYRLALLGRIDPASAARYAAPHRMFALAARLSPGNAQRGVFSIEHGEGGEALLEINQSAIDRDPEQLRQWLHHSRAALAFELVALGGARDRVLLGPTTAADATARVEGLRLLVRSLGVLVRDEGPRLADRLAARFHAIAEGTPQRYQPVSLDVEAQVVQRHALEFCAELVRLCFDWSPDAVRTELVDEVLESLRAVGPLFDEHALARFVKDAEADPPNALAYLQRLSWRVLEIAPEDRGVALEPHRRKRLTLVAASHLRVKLIYQRYQESGSAECEQLAEELELARRDDPASPFLEYVAARVLTTGGFLDEATRAIAAFHKVAKGDHPLRERVEEVQKAVDQARKDGRAGKRTQHDMAAPATTTRELDARELELEEQPAAIQLYVELCHDLALANRWREAHAWAERATARCLTSASQLRARELALELLGLEVLAAADRDVVASYLAGARTAALALFDRTPVGGVGLEYVRGQCLLAADRRLEARAAFASALDVCERGIYVAALRPLAASIEHVLLETARQEIDAACRDRRYHDAYARISERMATVAAPEPYLLELARVQFAALLVAVGTPQAPVPPPAIEIAAPWRDALAAAVAAPDAIVRTRLILDLAMQYDAPRLRDVQALLRKLDDLSAQLATADVLERANARSAAGDFAGALDLLREVGPSGDGNPRIVRQRALVLLQLEHYEAADLEVQRLGEIVDAVAREFVARYPKLRLNRRIAAATARLRTRDVAGARAMLEDAEPADAGQAIELAYLRACCAATEGYHRDEQGDRGAARSLLFEALRLAESCLAEARSTGHDRLLALHRKLEDDVAALERGRP